MKLIGSVAVTVWVLYPHHVANAGIGESEQGERAEVVKGHDEEAVDVAGGLVIPVLQAHARRVVLADGDQARLRQRGQGNGDGEHPDARDHRRGLFGCDPAHERVHHGDVTVHSHGHQGVRA